MYETRHPKSAGSLPAVLYLFQTQQIGRMANKLTSAGPDKEHFNDMFFYSLIFIAIKMTKNK